ncbi:MAG: hypothetical protein Q8Q14_04675 [Gemmatimonadales bacterium]|nr:hypothetical protein [Gemmatimonadales bacterium]
MNHALQDTLRRRTFAQWLALCADEPQLAALAVAVDDVVTSVASTRLRGGDGDIRIEVHNVIRAALALTDGMGNYVASKGRTT